jgi:hypothetical protein
MAARSDAASQSARTRGWASRPEFLAQLLAIDAVSRVAPMVCKRHHSEFIIADVVDDAKGKFA